MRTRITLVVEIKSTKGDMVTVMIDKRDVSRLETVFGKGKGIGLERKTGRDDEEEGCRS